MGGESKFYCRGATVYFIYSFVLSGDQKILVDPKTVVEHRNSFNRPFDDHEETSGLEAPESRRGITPHLSLQSGSAWISHPQLKGAVGQLDVEISRLVRIFPNGGTCCIKVRVPLREENELSSGDVLNLIRLVERGAHYDRPQELEIYFAGSGTRMEGTYSLFELFQELVDDAISPTADNGKSETLHWLGKREHMFLNGDFAREIQSPWVVTVLDVDPESDVADAFCSTSGEDHDPALTKMKKIRRYQEDIAPILFRSVSEDFKLEPAYLDPPTPGGAPGLFSINVDARLYVAMSRRAMLCMSADSTKDPARYFMPGLLDLCEMVRAQCHALIIMNKKLDHTLRDLHVITSRDRLERRKEIMHVKAWLATCLEDPAIHRIAGDAQSQIYRDLVRFCEIEHLQALLLQKLNLLDRVYQDLVAMSWADFDDDDEIL